MEKSKGRKISNSDEWLLAARGFGTAMSGDPTPHLFSWMTYNVFLDRISSLFRSNWSFSSVIDYERSFRKWRRANKFGWEVLAEWIRDSCLKPKFSSALPPLLGSATVPVSQGNGSKQPKNRCRDFGRGSCTRLASCTWSHQCSRCNTTWPTTSSKCLCVNGSKPPHISLPPGVVFGQ